METLRHAVVDIPLSFEYNSPRLFAASGTRDIAREIQSDAIPTIDDSISNRQVTDSAEVQVEHQLSNFYA